MCFHDFLKLLLHAFSAFFSASPAAPAQERTLTNHGFRVEGIADFACRPFSRGTGKQQHEGNLSNNRPEKSSSNEGGAEDLTRHWGRRILFSFSYNLKFTACVQQQSRTKLAPKSISKGCSPPELSLHRPPNHEDILFTSWQS